MEGQRNHQYWMSRAINLARLGWYSTHPNPRVGCVIVRDNEMLGEGFHEYPGGPHAEVNALSQVHGEVEGATVYVTLEPCSHTGKTPPCATALIEARPAQVVIGMQDPNPLVAGKGIQMLTDAGIDVISGIMQQQVEVLNPGFIKRMTQGLPFVRVKMATSMDGRSALSNGLSQWISGGDSRRDVHYLRASSSAILSTADTVIADNASLNVRLSREQLKQDVKIRQPVRIVLDPLCNIKGDEKLFGLEGDVWVIRPQQESRYLTAQDIAKVRVINQPLNMDQTFDLNALMKLLASEQINEIHTECGSGLAGALLQHGLVDELVLYQAACLLGNQGKGLFDLDEISIMSDRVNLDIKDIRKIGPDLKIIAQPV